MSTTHEQLVCLFLFLDLLGCPSRNMHFNGLSYVLVSSNERLGGIHNFRAGGVINVFWKYIKVFLQFPRTRQNGNFSFQKIIFGGYKNAKLGTIRCFMVLNLIIHLVLEACLLYHTNGLSPHIQLKWGAFQPGWRSRYIWLWLQRKLLCQLE